MHKSASHIFISWAVASSLYMFFLTKFQDGNLSSFQPHRRFGEVAHPSRHATGPMRSLILLDTSQVQ